MKKSALAKVVSVALMTLTVLAVAILGMAGRFSWAGTALAQGTGTVPEPPQALLLARGKPEPPVPGTCGLPDSDTASGFLAPAHARADESPAGVGDPVTRVLELSTSSAQLTSAFNVASYSAELVPPELLPDSPEGWDLINCGMRTTGQSTSGTPVVLFRRGQLICFETAPGFSQYAIFYFDPTPTINRWVKLGTVVDLIENEACTSPTFRLPALFSLFGVP